MAKTTNEMRYERGKREILAYLNNVITDVTGPREARKHAEESLDTLKVLKDAELEKANKQFKRFQILEFVVGAVFLIQMVIFLVHGEPYIWPLVATSALCAILYVVVAFLDSKAKNRRQNIYFETLAIKKTRITYNADDPEIIIKFKSLGS